MSIKPDNVVISILNSLYPDIQFIADNGDGVHLKTVFGLVGEVSNKTIGTMRKAIRSSDGKYFHAQPKEYLLNIGVQGTRKSNAYDIAEEIQFLLNTGRYKALFKQKGFSIRVDHKDIDSIPIQMDTSWFVRYQFSIYLTTDVIMMIDNISIDGVNVKGTIEDLEGETVYQYLDEVRLPQGTFPLLDGSWKLNGLKILNGNRQ